MTRDGFLTLLHQLDNPDTVVPAARRLTFELKRAKMTWTDVIDKFAFAMKPEASSHVNGAGGPFENQATWLLTHGALTDWERGFVKSVAAWQKGTLSDKMQPIWDRVLEKNAGLMFGPGGVAAQRKLFSPDAPF